MNEYKQIKDMNPGDNSVHFKAILSKVTAGKTNGANKSNYLSMTLSDNTGSIDAKYWNASDDEVRHFKAGMVVDGQGDIIKYNNQRQMKVIRVMDINISDEEKYALAPSAPIDAAQAMKLIHYTIDHMTNKTLKAITEKLIADNESDFKYSAAATRNHHEYVSGLLQHTVTMLKVAKRLMGEFSTDAAKNVEALYDGIDKDLLYAGVILHDIGKIKELTTPIAPNYTVEGNLVGHISLGAQMVRLCAHDLGFAEDDENVTLLVHMLLAHHGLHEYGSPVLPAIPEAELLNLIDNMDARMNMFAKTLSDVAPGEFSQRVYSLDGRMLYRKKESEGA